MENTGQELLMDWYVRYNSILKKRYTRREKDRFLDSLVTDIKKIRSDVQVDAFKFFEKDTRVYRNVYAGDMKKARRIICTYYDTPAVHLVPYTFFDTKKKQKNATLWILASSLCYILAGLAVTWFIAIPVLQGEGLFSVKTLLLILFYLGYFLLMGQVTRGLGTKRTLVQNTASVLVLLDLIQELRKSPDTAFAFLDAGCTNDAGLVHLMKRKKSQAVFYMLDSVCSEYPMYLVSDEADAGASGSGFSEAGIEAAKSGRHLDERLRYLISGERREDCFQLPVKALRKNEMQDERMAQVLQFFEKMQ